MLLKVEKKNLISETLKIIYLSSFSNAKSRHTTRKNYPLNTDVHLT
jgi:hypothetical protein